MLRFAANLTRWYPERPFLDRFELARSANFDAVEFMFPYQAKASEVQARREETGLGVVAFNLPAGNWAQGERGIAIFADRVDEFRWGFDQALTYAEALNCWQLTCLAGLCPPALPKERARDILIENVCYAADLLAPKQGVLLIEPINALDMPEFFLHTVDEVMQVIHASGRSNVRLQFDVYHQQRTQGELIGTFQRLKAWIGHIQIADSPGRHQPGTGEICYEHVFKAIEEAEYQGAVGLEYDPVGDSVASLQWRDQYWLNNGVTDPIVRGREDGHHSSGSPDWDADFPGRSRRP